MASIGEHGLIFPLCGNLDGAMALLKEQEHLCRELGDSGGLAISLVNQAGILGLSMDRLKEGLPLADEALRLASEHGYIPLAKQIEHLRDQIRQRLGQWVRVREELLATPLTAYEATGTMR